MRHHNEYSFNAPIRQAKQRNTVAKAHLTRQGVASSKRLRGGQANECHPFAPPEDWHEPTDQKGKYRVVQQPPGVGYRHILSPGEIQDRLRQLPGRFLDSLEVVQLSRMTVKKQSFPCYGMQWGNALYLYPIEESLVEYFDRPPRPNLFNEARMYGGRWVQEAHLWRLIWNEASIKDFYLNNILIHELGHLVDDRNSSYLDRERYAEWFAIHYGYRPSRATVSHRRPHERVVRRHHQRSGL